MKPRQWHFTIFLLVSYIAIFHLWRCLSGEWILVTGLVASAILSGTLFAVGRGYFVNLWDRVFHAVVILDILLEGFFEDHFGFYWCAFGFAVLIVGYRLLRRNGAKAVRAAH
jgi:hypothetical protein